MTGWWDRSLLVAGWALLAVGGLVWWTARSVPGFSSTEPLLAITLAGLVLVVATSWRVRSPSIIPLPSAFGLATAAPLAMAPLMAAATIAHPAAPVGSVEALPTGLFASGGPVILAWFALIAATAAAAPFCWELTRRVPAGSGRRLARLALAAGLVSALIVAGVSASRVPVTQTGTIGPTDYWWLVMTFAVVTVSAAAAVETSRSTAHSRASATRATLGYIGMGLTVSAATLVLASAWWPTLGLPALVAAIATAVLGRVAVRPLEAEVDAAHRERDLVMSTLEAERRRIASDIHDGPLADLTLLTLQLDAAGDRNSAELVRSITSELRSLGDDLRIPILDDLGAGPAIEWLAGRVDERTHIGITTDVQGGSHRPPAAVELAIFRIAQEAIFNAAQHGRGPVVVRYEAEPSMAWLSVTDAGPGISAVAQEEAQRAGHLGLALMARRAEAIGARLQVSPALGGGTRVNVEWASA